MESLKALGELGVELGYEGEELKDFVKEQQDRQREERKEKRESLQREQDADREKHEHELRLAKLKFEAEMKLAERDRSLEEEQFEMQLLETEHKQKLELLHKQQNLKISMVSASPSSTMHSIPKIPKMLPFDECRDEMDSYLRRFERYAMAVQWPKETWATNLSALLKGKALGVYARMPVEKALDYDELNSALLKRFEFTEEGFKRRFRSCRPEDGETYSQFAVSLESYLKRWIDMAEIDKTFEGLLDLMIRDQLLHICNKELTLFLLERIPKNSRQMAKFADQYCEARVLPASTFVFRRGEPSKPNKSAERGRSSDRKVEFSSDSRNDP